MSPKHILDLPPEILLEVARQLRPTTPKFPIRVEWFDSIRGGRQRCQEKSLDEMRQAFRSLYSLIKCNKALYQVLIGELYLYDQEIILNEGRLNKNNRRYVDIDQGDNQFNVVWADGPLDRVYVSALEWALGRKQMDTVGRVFDAGHLKKAASLGDVARAIRSGLFGVANMLLDSELVRADLRRAGRDIQNSRLEQPGKESHGISQDHPISASIDAGHYQLVRRILQESGCNIFPLWAGLSSAPKSVFSVFNIDKRGHEERQSGLLGRALLPGLEHLELETFSLVLKLWECSPLQLRHLVVHIITETSARSLQILQRIIDIYPETPFTDETLCAAAWAGKADIFDFLLERGATIYPPTPHDEFAMPWKLRYYDEHLYYRYPLYSAIRGGNASIVEKLLQRGASVCFPGPEQPSEAWTRDWRRSYTPSAINTLGVAQHTSIEVARLILEHLSGSSRQVDMTWALEGAVANDNVPLASLLLQHGADAKTLSPSALGQAKSSSMLELVIAHGANIDAIGNQISDFSKFHFIKNGPTHWQGGGNGPGKLYQDWEYGDQGYRMSALAWAVGCATEKATLDGLRFLAANVANVDATDEKGRTALWYSCFSSNTFVRTHAFDIKENHKVASRLETCNVLLSAGADATIAELLPPDADTSWSLWSLDPCGRAPLDGAVYMENREIIESLLRAGADPNIKCPKGETIFCRFLKEEGGYVVDHRFARLVDLFLHCGADPNAESLGFGHGMGRKSKTRGRTPLQILDTMWRNRTREIVKYKMSEDEIESFLLRPNFKTRPSSIANDGDGEEEEVHEGLFGTRKTIKTEGSNECDLNFLRMAIAKRLEHYGADPDTRNEAGERVLDNIYRRPEHGETLSGLDLARVTLYMTYCPVERARLLEKVQNMVADDTSRCIDATEPATEPVEDAEHDRN